MSTTGTPPSGSVDGLGANSCLEVPAGRKLGAVGLLRHTGAIIWKDLRVEMRSGEIVLNMTFFAAMVVLIFSFAFVKETGVDPTVVPGLLWVALTFAGTLGLSRAFDRERDGDTMRALLLSPAPRASIFLGKALAISVLIAMTAVVLVPVSMILLAAPLMDYPLALITFLTLGIFGIAIVGSTFSAMLLRVRSRDVLLPVMLYPILAPLLLIGTQATTKLVLETPDIAGAWRLARFLGAYDLVFLVFALWIFESVVIE